MRLEPAAWERGAPAPHDGGAGAPRSQDVSDNADGLINAGAPQSKGKGWYSRGYLPHCDEIGLIQSLTFRLADSLPQSLLRQFEEELRAIPTGERDVQRRTKIEQWLDAGMGCCALRHPAVAAVMQNALFHADGRRYRLLAWCVMPNHVHVLIKPLVALPLIVRTWKSYTGHWALAHNEELGLGVAGGVFWMSDVWDRFMRDEKHLRTTLVYIHENPAKARLCKRPEDWRWSSAYVGAVRGGSPAFPGR